MNRHSNKGRRMRLAGGRGAPGLLVVMLGLLLAAPLLAADPDDEVPNWRVYAEAEDVPRIEQALARARVTLEALPANEYGVAERPQVLAFLDAEALPRPAERLHGEWRCRSIQVNAYGLFSYPRFRCRILPDGALLAFNKLSGSQRRSGELFVDAPGRWVFLGGSHVNEDEPRGYTRRGDLEGEGSIESRASDTVGILETLADGRLRMIFDADGESVELYELSR